MATQLIAAAGPATLGPYLAGEEHDTALVALGRRWRVHVHEPHAHFCDESDGLVVDAHIWHPTVLDPASLLRFAQTCGRHPQALSLCPEGYDDMFALLESHVPDWDVFPA